MQHQSLLSPLRLTAEEIKQFLQLAQAHRSPQALARRAQIVLAAHDHPTWSSQHIAQYDAGKRLIRSKMLPDQEHLACFPLRCVPR